MSEVEALGCRHSRALRKSVSTVEGIQHQGREFGQLAAHVEENGKRLVEIEEALSGLHGYQAAAHLFNVRLEKIETYLDQVGQQGTTACQHDFDSRRSHELCISLNTSTKKPCKLSSANCPYPEHRKPNQTQAKTKEACLARTKKGGKCQNNLFSCPHIGHQKHREARIAELEHEAGANQYADEEAEDDDEGEGLPENMQFL
ncbi:unnamed protein product [Aphanomyces euteiches]|nr:hypothetical protein AeRB84_007272 [Aphanomyces euteiches]